MISIWLVSPYFIVHSKFEVIMFVVNGSQYVMYTFVFIRLKTNAHVIQIDLCFFRLVYCFFCSQRGEHFEQSTSSSTINFHTSTKHHDSLLSHSVSNVLHNAHLLSPSASTHQCDTKLSSPIQVCSGFKVLTLRHSVYYVVQKL